MYQENALNFWRHVIGQVLLMTAFMNFYQENTLNVWRQDIGQVLLMTTFMNSRIIKLLTRVLLTLVLLTLVLPTWVNYDTLHFSIDTIIFSFTWGVPWHQHVRGKWASGSFRHWRWEDLDRFRHQQGEKDIHWHEDSNIHRHWQWTIEFSFK